LSALRRQRQRFKFEEEWKKQERHMRIIERVQQIRDIWERWTNKSISAGAEHESRLNNFRKNRDCYTDPDDMIRQKREERLQREKMIRLEQEKKRQEILEKKRFRLPKIIVTQYFDIFETRDEPRAQSSKNESPGVLPNLVNIPCGSESEKKREENDTESQGSKGDRLELPDLENITQEGGYVEELAQADEQYESLLPEHENQVDATSITDANDSNSQEIDHGADVENVALEDGSEKTMEVDVSQSEVAAEPESEPVLEDVNTKTDELDILRTEQENIPGTEKENIPKTEQEPLDISSPEQNEQYNAANENGERKLEGNESERRIEEKESEEEFQKKESEIKVDEKKSEIEQEKKEIQINFLSPPAVMADENFSDHGSIGDADDTAFLMAAFVPVALGVGDGLIPDDAMRASSVLDRYHVPSQARLNNTKQGKSGGAWKPKLNDKKQYLEVDLGALTNVSQVATQGYGISSGGKVQKKDKCWVESYTLSFSTDGSQWQQYTENDAVKVFKGNRNNNSVVINSISNPVQARFVRFISQTWKNSIAMRVEVYGEVTEPDMSRNTPPAPSPIEEEQQEEDQRTHEVILEDQEEPQVEEFVCGDESKEVVDEQNAWEEETEYSVVETASQMESKGMKIELKQETATNVNNKCRNWIRG